MKTIVFVDGQHLYHAALRAWGARHSADTLVYSWPSYDVEALSNHLVNRIPGRTLAEIRFYTGVPETSNEPKDNFWHDFWKIRIRFLRRRGIYTYIGRINSGGQEKGVDVSLAIDLVQATHERRYDAAIIVSQDWDFGPAVRLSKQIAEGQGRWLSFESTFPVGPGTTYTRGVPGTDWVPIEKAAYDACLDPRDYRPKRRTP